MNFNKIYGKVEKASNKYEKASKIIEQASLLEQDACNEFNSQMKLEYMEQLRVEIEKNGYRIEIEQINELINKMQNKGFEIEDLRKYKILDEKYGEDLPCKQNFIQRFMENKEALS